MAERANPDAEGMDEDLAESGRQSND